MKRAAALVAMVLGAAAGSHAAGLRNDGFESSDFTGWEIYGNGWRVSPLSRDSHRGTYGAVNDVWTNSADQFRVVAQKIKVVPGKVYRAEVWIRAVCIEATESFLEVQFLDKDGGVLQQFQSTRVRAHHEYGPVAIERMKAPENAAWAGVRGVVEVILQPSMDTDFHVFDDFEFEPVKDGPAAAPEKK